MLYRVLYHTKRLAKIPCTQSSAHLAVCYTSFLSRCLPVFIVNNMGEHGTKHYNIIIIIMRVQQCNYFVWNYTRTCKKSLYTGEDCAT